MDVGFNREVAEDSALYWGRENGELAGLIDRADAMSEEDIRQMGQKARNRVAEAYTWEKICGDYMGVFTDEKPQ